VLLATRNSSGFRLEVNIDGRQQNGHEKIKTTGANVPVDGYIAGPNGEMDWRVWNWDDKLKEYVNELTESVDTILLGRKMTEGFVSQWSDVMTKPFA
jgi:RibD C-terminal domain